MAFVWIADATAASYLTSDGPPLCTNPEHPISRTWDICIVHSVMYPLSWFSAAIGSYSASTLVHVTNLLTRSDHNGLRAGHRYSMALSNRESSKFTCKTEGKQFQSVG